MASQVEYDSHWRGVHASQLQTSFNHYQFPKLIFNDEHTILVKVPITLGTVPECYPSTPKKDYWDQHHVKLPCSENNITKEHTKRWKVIREAFSSQLLSSQKFEAAILSYNKRYTEYWSFSALHSFFKDALDECETAYFFESLLKRIVDLALCLPQCITTGIPLLKRGFKHSISLSQLQIACLLANAFLCTFPHRNWTGKNSEYCDYPDINFNRLFQCEDPTRLASVHEKLKCIINYFRRVTSAMPTGVVTYSRQLIPNHLYPEWTRSTRTLPRLYVSSSGTIEDDGFGLFQVDFANKFVGGGVIGTGCVQEEIRFVVCPELILSRLFTQSLGENEALVVIGCERFNKYVGYASTFKWDGDYLDATPCDEYSRKYCTVIALDALCYKRNPSEQYSPEGVFRDLNKAYVGFSWGSSRKREELCAIATGNWGCGVFMGDPQLKLLIQLMAAAEVNRDLAYFTFDDTELRDSMASIHQFLRENGVTVGRICEVLKQYNSKKLYIAVNLFDFMRSEAVCDPETPTQKEQGSSSSKLFSISATPKLEVTKRSFCYRMKSNRETMKGTDDVIRPSNNQIEDSYTENEHWREELQSLTSIYDPNFREKSKPDSFEFLDQFKKKLRAKTYPVRDAVNDHKADEAILASEGSHKHSVNSERISVSNELHYEKFESCGAIPFNDIEIESENLSEEFGTENTYLELKEIPFKLNIGPVNLRPPDNILESITGESRQSALKILLQLGENLVSLGPSNDNKMDKNNFEKSVTKENGQSKIHEVSFQLKENSESFRHENSVKESVKKESRESEVQEVPIQLNENSESFGLLNDTEMEKENTFEELVSKMCRQSKVQVPTQLSENSESIGSLNDNEIGKKMIFELDSQKITDMSMTLMSPVTPKNVEMRKESILEEKLSNTPPLVLEQKREHELESSVRKVLSWDNRRVKCSNTKIDRLSQKRKISDYFNTLNKKASNSF